MCCDRRFSTVIAVEWMVRLREARLGTNVPMILVMMGTNVLCRIGTMLLNACRAWRFTLLLRSVNLRQNPSNTLDRYCTVSTKLQI